MKNWFVSILSILLAINAWAYNVSGTVTDPTGEPMPMATVRILTLKDSTAVKGAITNDAGKFSITDVKKGKYILETSYVGYTPMHKNIDVRQNLSLGNITLSENASVLKEVSVTGIKTPIKVMEDTVEFNADSYKTQPNAVVEDLLKRLPGVEVDSEGKITHNGKEIKKILVDGQEFFSDDPKVASKNLPVNIVEKLQVIDRKSDLARLTGVDDGEDETVINLSVKKGMNNGWMGNVEAGYGTDDRYKGSFMINKFWNGNQLTFLGGLNNVNESNFTDGGGRFRRFGGANGITKSDALGINFNVGNGEILRVGGDVMYSHSNADTRTELNRQYLFNDSSSFYDSKKNSIDATHNISANFRLKWDPDSFNTFEFRPNMSINFSDSHSDEISNTHAGFRNSNLIGALVNNNTNLQKSHGSSYEFGGRLIYTHRFRQRRGRSLSFYAQLRTSNVREKANTFSDIVYHLLNDSALVYDQFEDNHTWSNTLQSRVSWTEPIGNVSKGNFLEFAYQFQYRWNNADKLTYDRIPTLPENQLYELNLLPTDVLNDTLSNRFRNDYMNQDIRIGYKHVTAATNLNVGISLVPQMQRSINLIDENKNIPERWVWNFAPYLRFRYKMSKTRSLNAFYQGRSSQPSMNQLQPVADTSDPLHIVQGNPYLDPSFMHNLNLRFQDFNQESQRSIMAMIRASLTQNSIVSRTTFNQETGGQFTTYENVNGVWSVNAFSMVSFPLRNKSWTINNHLGANFNHNVGFNNGLKNNSGNLGLFESFGIAFRPDNLELELRPNYRLQYSTNTVQTTANRTVHSYGGMFSGTYYAPFGLVLNTDLNYTANKGYGAGYNKNEWMWNASVSYQFLSSRSLIVTLSAHDLLQQRSNVQRTVNASYIQDALYNSLTRYVMLSVSYKFNTFGKGQEPADRNRPDFGGERPMGPPPGGAPGGGGRGRF